MHPDSSELRIVSLLPSATEMLGVLGLLDRLVGRSHACDFPPAATAAPVVVRHVLPSSADSPAVIDRAVRETLAQARPLYEVEVEHLRSLRPTLLLGQNLCQVCAVGGSEIERCLREWPSPPQALSFSPQSLADIEEDLCRLARATDTLDRAEAWLAESRRRWRNLRKATPPGARRPRVVCLEWIDPFFCSGHWIPEMVEIAGGTDLLGRPRSHSVPVACEDILAAQPDILIVMPCGFDEADAKRQAQSLMNDPRLAELPAVRRKRVHAVDPNLYTRPGPRLIDGAELLAHCLQLPS